MDSVIQHRLQNLEQEVLLELLYSCSDDICGRKIKSYKNFKSFVDWSCEDYDETCMKIKDLLYRASGSNFQNEQVLCEIAQLDASHQKCFLDCLEVCRENINSALKQKSCGISGPSLQDFDWKLKWVMGSSKLSSLREPLLTVDFCLSEEKIKNDISETTVSLELNKNELAMLLAALEKAQEKMNGQI